MKRTNRSKNVLARWARQALVAGPLAFIVVAGSGCPSLFEGGHERAVRIRQALVGRDGAQTITTANMIVNAYAALSPTSNPAVGDRTVTVANIATLNAGNALFTTDLGRGDLILIIQMAGATINTMDTVNYGAIADATALGNAGRYELAGVESVAGNVISLACGLKNSYSGNGKVQVIRVPQYTTLTINSGASITAPLWNGTVGGVVAVHADSTLQLNGQINVTGKGFRGGAAAPTAKTSNNGVTGYRFATNATGRENGAEKGEGIAGDQTDYDGMNGRYGRGAPANGGGGGDAHNAGGGGGANARSGSAWNGQGVMLASITGAAAWTLDPAYIANGNAFTTSEGGGRGGYSYSNAAADPFTAGPGNVSWDGDNRRSVGGLGGRPLDGSPTSRLFLGGGGGAGDGNDGSAGNGGNGGGLVFLIAGSVTGAGSIVADGGAGGSANGNPGDAAGGGGGGGTVVVHAVTLGSITITADGGAGGNHLNSSSNNEVEGPGGGGGGGYIAVSGGTPTRSAAGGLGGTTNRSVMSTFPSDGATAGNAGKVDGDATAFSYCGSMDPPDTTIAVHPDNPSSSTTGSFTFEATQTVAGIDGSVSLIGSATFECKLDAQPWQPCGVTYTTPTLTEGSHTLSVRATDLSGHTDATPDTFTWTVAENTTNLDAGTLDADIDGGGSVAFLDGGQDDGAGTVLLDAEAKADTAGVRDDVAKADVSVVAGPDTGPAVAVDATDSLPLLDSGEAVDGGGLLLDGALADATDVQSAGPETGRDATATAEPSPDTAPLMNPDVAAPPINKDAGADNQFQVLGGGFCSVTGSRSTSTMGWIVLVLAGLAVLGRRRRR